MPDYGDGRIILKWILNKEDVTLLVEFMCVGIRSRNMLL